MPRLEAVARSRPYNRNMTRVSELCVPPTLGRRLLSWYDGNRRDLPWRVTDDPYAIWVSEIMLQQTQVATVIPYFERFIACFPNVQCLAEADLEHVLRIWAGLGYYARARNLHRAAGIIVARHGGCIPRDVAELRRLPGLGRYTAAAIASIAFGARVPAIDGNVTRVMARLIGLSDDPRSAVGRRRIESIVERLLPTQRCGDFNQAMMELGATICLPGGRARCSECPLRRECRAYRANRVAEIPPARIRSPQLTETRLLVALHDGPRWLFLRREESGLWGGLWELPNTECGVDPPRTASGLRKWASQALHPYRRLAPVESASFRRVRLEPRPFCDFAHVLTHRRFRFIGVMGEWPGAGAVGRAHHLPSGDVARWVDMKEVSSLPLSRAMRRAWSEILAAVGNARGPVSLPPRRYRAEPGSR